MEYTANYHLPQWVETDRIMMEDFNEAMAAIEKGLTEGYHPGNYPYVIGSYVGNGTTQTIELGFRPRFLTITGTQSGTNSYSSTYRYETSTGGEQSKDTVQLTDTGFTVSYVTDGGVTINDIIFPALNRIDVPDSYIAFR